MVKSINQQINWPLTTLNSKLANKIEVYSVIK
jgi:hypothetical protein